ncbi:hypothetical protein LTR91_001022 [Friedmanniomyces endolithicus]|uniref:AB hydrolase-1 domain-containing protein n=1 Tax=Friedmanniomyces endolithicus TaxID=329885 RepID=A0AAN6L1D0_9PEZI|nr:hypothetical protein LTR57_010025 [Friedmanniomyces endolithicus]KAK1011481.1 hypothetical protein LTS01_001337 [Friedmanniomyces endolithicus]KAK1014159.1 hypothetical protein LTR91_001022 [Friedmanniomyces endolithicus]KAK1033974.1 hypothetical protein LTS16_015796 [Friedmanniomyces endolithicus]
MSVSQYATQGVALLWGLVALAVTTLRSYANRKSSSAEQYRLLRDAQHKLWSLEDEAIPGLHHNFLTLSSGLQVHYVATGGQQTATKSLVIFLHGFPDSWYIYKRFLESTTLKATGAQLVALDLPGCGGSDDLRKYGPDEMLNAVGEAIALLKARYLIGGDRRSECMLASHDWGGFISYRIAAETVGLVNRVVAINIGYMPVMRGNSRLAIEDARAHFAAWTRDYMKVNLVFSAWRSIAPLAAQLLMSSYVFMFNLPHLVLTMIPSTTMAYLLDWCHHEGHHRRAAASKAGQLSELLLAESRASSFGPSSAEFTSPKHNNKTYSSSVRSRASTSPPGDWLQRIRLYREGLASDKWNLAPTLQQYRPAPEMDEETFKCPVTAIFGLQDVAIEPRVALNGIERYFLRSAKDYTGHGSQERQPTFTTAGAGGSHIVRLKDCGHWSLLEELGSGVVEKTLLWLLSQQNGTAGKGSLEEALISDELAHHVTIETYG